MNRKSSRVLLTLFLSMLKISACTFGGGFVIVTFMRRKFVEELHWIDETEMLDMIAIAQSSPGAIAVNASILVGWKVGGLPGMLSAVLGTIIPPMVILGVISVFYQAFASNRYVALVLQGMQCAVSAVILDVALSLGQKTVREGSAVHVGIMLAAFIATFFFHVNVVLIILLAVVVGMIQWTLSSRRKGGRA